MANQMANSAWTMRERGRMRLVGKIPWIEPMRELL
jgi:hypothetical protein